MQVVLQSGLDEKWWADYMGCYCCLRNVQDFFWNGKTPFERRCGEPFRGTVIPCGSMVEHHSVSGKDQARLQQFGEKVLLGIILGYALYAVCIWKGDIMVADSEELENLDVSQIHARRLNAQEVLMQKMLIFSHARSQMDQSKLSWRDQVFRRSTSNQDHPARREEHNDVLRGRVGRVSSIRHANG